MEPVTEKREVRRPEATSKRRPASEAIRRNLEALEALERKHSGGKASNDTAKLRAEVEQVCCFCKLCLLSLLLQDFGGGGNTASFLNSASDARYAHCKLGGSVLRLK